MTEVKNYWHGQVHFYWLIQISHDVYQLMQVTHFIQLKNIPINMILCRSKQYGRPWWMIFVVVDPMNWFFWPKVVEWIHVQEHDRPILIFLKNRLRNQGKIEVLPQILQEIYWLLHGLSLSDLGNPILSISPHFHFGCLTDTGGRVYFSSIDIQWFSDEFPSSFRTETAHLNFTIKIQSILAKSLCQFSTSFKCRACWMQCITTTEVSVQHKGDRNTPTGGALGWASWPCVHPALWSTTANPSEQPSSRWSICYQLSVITNPHHWGITQLFSSSSSAKESTPVGQMVWWSHTFNAATLLFSPMRNSVTQICDSSR